MLEARSVALVGASPRPGSLGNRMIAEVAKSPSSPVTYLVNPRYATIGHGQSYPGLAALPGPVDLALLAVPDAALEEQVKVCADATARSVVIFGSALDPGDSPGSADEDRGHRGAGRAPVVRRGLHGVRERGAGPAGDRLRRARPAARGAGRAGHPLRFGVLGPAALPAGVRVLARGLLRAGTRHDGRRVRAVRAQPARDQGPRPRPRDDPGRPRAARRPRRRRRTRRPGRPAARGLVGYGGRSMVAAHSGALAAGDGAWQALAVRLRRAPRR